MTAEKTTSAIVRYPHWELRPDEHCLLVRGSHANLGGRAYELLLALAKRPGATVTKEALLEAVWPGLVVEENNISVQISELRKLLGREAIQTVARVGYRLATPPSGEAPEGRGTGSGTGGGTAVALEAPGPWQARPELVGRDNDLEELRERLATGTLTTLVGTGGVGKTTLAHELSARIESTGAEVFWVDLAPIRDPRQVVQALSKVLRIQLASQGDPLDELAFALVGKRAFIVLDNCEHLLDEAARCVRRILDVGAQIRWLATSQTPLRLPGENVYRLEPLEVPPRGLECGHALEYGALALLSRRAMEADRRFRLDESNVDAAVSLCAQLDGLPLAIEMAAARVGAVGLEAVLQQLGRQLHLLKGRRGVDERHRTLQATLDWSYGLLSPSEQAVFRRLEPFLGGFTLAMTVEVVCDPDDPAQCAAATIDAVAELVDRSLVHRSAVDPRRFHLLESAREYARTQLEATGEWAAVRSRHMRAVALSFAQAPADAEELRDAEWIDRYAAERHNARAALDWASREGAADELARLVAAVALTDKFFSRQAEILQCDVPLALLDKAEPRLRAWAALELAWAHHLDGDRRLGVELADKAFTIFEALDVKSGQYRALAQLARQHESRLGGEADAHAAWLRMCAMDSSDVRPRTHLFCEISGGLLQRPQFGSRDLEELRQRAIAAGFDAQAAICAANMTDKLLVQRDYELAVDTIRGLLESTEKYPRAHGLLQQNLALALIQLGRTAEAYEPGRRAFVAMPAVGHHLAFTFALGAAREGRLADAAVLYGCVTRYREERHGQADRSEADAIAAMRPILDAGLSPQRLAERMRDGRAMSIAQALTEFFNQPRADATAAASAVPSGPTASPDRP